MYRISTHKVQSRFGVILLAIFVSSLLIQPAHILLAHHELPEGVGANEHGLVITTDHYKDCPICNFEFCTFIPQKQISLPQAIEFNAKQETVKTVACLASISSHLFQLRAPPTL